MAIGYTEIDFLNGSAPALNATNLNKMDEAIKDACDLLDAETTAGRALVEAADAAAQRSALGLGDSATKSVGTGAGDVAAGDAPAAAQAAAEATAAGALAGHVAAADPHTQYAKEADLGDSATLDVGTGAGDVAAGNAPADAVTTHESTYAHANLPTADEKTRLSDIQAASGATTAEKITALVPEASTSVAGKVALAADGGTIAETVVQGNDSRLPYIKSAVPTPVGFSWIAHDLVGKLFTDGNRGYRTSFDITSKYPATGDIAYIAPNGSISNDGLSPATPKRTIDHVLAAYPNIGTIRVAAGIYYRADQASTYNLTNDLTIEGPESGRAILSVAQDSLTWTLTEGKTNTYQTTRTNVYAVIDISQLEDDGNNISYKNLVQKTSVDDVESSAGSWYLNGATLYVHTYESSPPDNTEILPLLNAWVLSVIMNTAKKLCIKNIEILGSAGNGVSLKAENYDNGAPTLVAKNIKVSNAKTNGIALENANGYLSDCMSLHNGADGYNYHNSIPFITANKIVELYCHGGLNGLLSATDINNGSSAHDGYKIIRLGGHYWGNKGGNIVDICETNDGTESWNIGCIVHDSVADNELSEVNYGYYPQGGEAEQTIKAWMDGCVAYGATYSIRAGDGGNGSALVYTRRIDIEGTVDIQTNGTVSVY